MLRNKIGIAYHQLMQLDIARKYYEQAVKLKPKYSRSHQQSGHGLLRQAKSYRRAISQYKKAIKLAPDSASHPQQPRHRVLRAQPGANWPRKSSASRSSSIPNVFEHHSSYGVMLQERSVQDRAKYHYWMAALYAQDGRNDLALQYLRKALEEGYKERKKLPDDPAFASLRELPEFKELIALEPRVL